MPVWFVARAALHVAAKTPLDRHNQSMPVGAQPVPRFSE
jgi:hypothetical protein